MDPIEKRRRLRAAEVRMRKRKEVDAFSQSIKKKEEKKDPEFPNS